MSDHQLAEELHKPVVRKFKKRDNIDNIWGVDLVDIQLISRFNIRFNV